MLPVSSLLATNVSPYCTVDCDCILTLLFDAGWLGDLLSTYNMKWQLSPHAIHTQRTILIGKEERFNMGTQNSDILLQQLTEIGFTHFFLIGGRV